MQDSVIDEGRLPLNIRGGSEKSQQSPNCEVDREFVTGDGSEAGMLDDCKKMSTATLARMYKKV